MRLFFVSMGAVHANAETLAEAFASPTTPSYIMTEDFTFTNDAYSLGGDEGRNFTIYGQGHAINGGAYDGMAVASGQTLLVDNAQISNFYPCALINYFGTLNVKDTIFTENTNDIYNNGALNLTGTNTISKIIADSPYGTMNMNGGTTEITTSITQNAINLISGELKLSSGTAASSITNNGFNASGGTLNIANNNIDILSFANTINNLNNFNLIIDVDADSETVTADKITANLNYANYVYLSALNFMNDSVQSGEVQIADGYLKGLLKLANNFDSGIYTTVGYNKTTGILSFADPVKWTKRTNGVNSIYKWTKTNTGLMPVSYMDQTFYVDILKEMYTDDNH